MSNESIRIGVVGAGANTTARHIPGLRAIDGVSIVSVCNRTPASSQTTATNFSIPKTYDTWQELVVAPDTDAIVIGTWPYMHHPVTLAALAAGKHVMCEARMAMNAREARDMLAVSRARPDLVAQIVPSPMTLAVDETIKRMIGEGYLGDILAIDVRATGNGAFLDAEANLHWRQDFDLSGYNILTLGIWYEALMRWVGEANRVMAMGKTFVKMRPLSVLESFNRRRVQSSSVRLDGSWPQEMKAVRVPEHLAVIADMNCGAQASFLFSAAAGLAGEDSVSLYGSEGTLRFVGGKLLGGKKGDANLIEIAIPDEERGGWRVEQEFVNAIRGVETITHTSFADGVKYMEFTEAVTRSMATGQAMALPLF